MRRTLAAALVIILMTMAVLLVPAPRVSASVMTNLNLASATFQGPLAYGSNDFGDSGVIYPQQGVRAWTSASLKGCEDIRIDTGPTGFGAGTGWFVGTVGGVTQALLNNAGATAGHWSRYSNNCAQGYNESAPLVLKTQVYAGLNSTSGGAGFAGSIRIGFTASAGTGSNLLCGPFIELKFASTGAFNNVKTGVGRVSSFLYGAGTSVTLANRTWYSVFVWSNKSRQDAVIAGGGSYVRVTSTFPFTTPDCGGSGLSQMTGANLFLNGTEGTPFGYVPLVAFHNMTVGSGSSSPVIPRAGYVRFASISPPSKLTEIQVTATIPPSRYNPSGSTYITAPSGGICPCYVNVSGVTIWQHSTTYTTTNYTTTIFHIPVTGVNNSASISMAFRFNSSDGLPRMVISSIAIPGSLLWTNPGEGGTTGAITQEASWVGPFVLFVLLVALGMAFYESFRRKLDV